LLGHQNYPVPDVTTKPESFRNLTERLACAAQWLEKGWPTRAEDVALANRIYMEWLKATDSEWLSSGERDRYPLIAALDVEFRLRHDERMAEHLCVVFTMAFEARANSHAGRRGNQH